jgi:ABC-type Fe3+/spermidine/putrescine transport system ATPase subunit
MDQTCVAMVGGSTRMEAARPSWDAKVGGQATLMVRPERLHLGPLGRGLPARLEAAVFQGPVIRCLLRTADGVEVVAHVGSEGERPELVTGREYSLNWDADAARLLHPAKASRALDQNSRTTIELASQ